MALFAALILALSFLLILTIQYPKMLVLSISIFEQQFVLGVYLFGTYNYAQNRNAAPSFRLC